MIAHVQTADTRLLSLLPHSLGMRLHNAIAIWCLLVVM